MILQNQFFKYDKHIKINKYKMYEVLIIFIKIIKNDINIYNNVLYKYI